MASAEGLVKTGKSSVKTRRRRRIILIAGVLGVLIIAALVFGLSSRRPAPVDAPEAEKVLEIQKDLHFGVLIPAYLPGGFDRENVGIKVNNNGPAGEPKVDLTYRNRNNSYVYIQEWLAVNPDMETLNGSRPIQTKWGKSWLLTQGKSLVALWVDVGPLRISLSTNNPEEVSREQLIMAGESLGLASYLQVYSFYNELPVIQDVPPPLPFEVPLNADGVQELNLTITPGGYSPIRFAVKKGVPVKLNFRALGEVGCGSTLIFPSDPESENLAALTVSPEQPVQTIEFTPKIAGEFGFRCSTNCYRGIMTVREELQK